MFLFYLLRGKIPQKDMELTFPGMSGDFTSENFSATWYLIENHSGSRWVILWSSFFDKAKLVMNIKNIGIMSMWNLLYWNRIGRSVAN